MGAGAGIGHIRPMFSRRYGLRVLGGTPGRGRGDFEPWASRQARIRLPSGAQQSALSATPAGTFAHRFRIRPSRTFADRSFSSCRRQCLMASGMSVFSRIWRPHSLAGAPPVPDTGQVISEPLTLPNWPVQQKVTGAEPRLPFGSGLHFMMSLSNRVDSLFCGINPNRLGMTRSPSYKNSWTHASMEYAQPINWLGKAA